MSHHLPGALVARTPEALGYLVLKRLLQNQPRAVAADPLHRILLLADTGQHFVKLSENRSLGLPSPCGRTSISFDSSGQRGGYARLTLPRTSRRHPAVGHQGTVWQYTAAGVASGFAWAELHATAKNRACASPPSWCTASRELKATGWRPQEATTDNGSEFRAREFGQAVEQLGARQRRIKAGRSASNGCVEPLQLTILDQRWRPAFARSLAPRSTALERGLDEYLDYFNFGHAHNGRLTKGRLPADIVVGARKTRTVK